MALFTQSGVITAPTTDGNDTVLSSLTTPKAIILWTTRVTTTGAVDAAGELYIGFATYDGGAVQQAYGSVFDTDAAATSDVARGLNTTACLKGYSAAATPTVDFELRLVSMDSTSITLDWFNAPAAAIKVGYLVLGGSDLAKARVGSFALTTAVATQQVTIASGWGQPDALMMLSTVNTSLGDQANAGRITIGAGGKNVNSRASLFSTNDGEATMDCGHWQEQSLILTISGGAQAAEADADLDAVGTWPTDGFQLTYTDQAGVASQNAYLALQGSFQKASGSNTNPTAGTPPVTQDNAVGFPGKCAIVFGGSLPTQTGINSTHADLGGQQFGATDGTNESNGARTEDDAAADSASSNIWSETKGLQIYVPNGTGAAALKAEADLSFSGNNFRASWTTIDAGAAREYNYFVFGDAPAGGKAIVAADLRRRQHMLIR